MPSTIALVRHRVVNFDAWKTFYDSLAPIQAETGYAPIGSCARTTIATTWSLPTRSTPSTERGRSLPYRS